MDVNLFITNLKHEQYRMYSLKILFALMLNFIIINVHINHIYFFKTTYDYSQ